MLHKFQLSKYRVNCYFGSFFFRTLTSNYTEVGATVKTALKSWDDVPGPSSLPVIGHLHHFLPGGSLHTVDGIEYFGRIHKTYGPLVRINSLFVPAMILLFDCDSMAKIYHNENSLPVRPGLYAFAHYKKHYKKDPKKYKNSTGLLSEHGELWKVVRNKVNVLMLQPNAMKCYIDEIDEVARDVITRLKTERDNCNMVTGSFLEIIEAWALDAAGVIALGTRLNSLHPTIAEDYPAKQLASFLKEFFKLLEELEFKPSVWKYYPTKSFKRLMIILEEIDSIINYYINMTVKNIKSKKPAVVKSVFEKLVDIDENIAHIMAYDTMPASIETTGKTTTMLLYYLATHPEKQQKLRDEINTKQKHPYMKACIKEALRLMPPSSINARETTKEHNILGYRIPKGVVVQFCHHYLSLSEDQFHSAREFIPERWTADASDPLYYGRAHPFAYIPFGFGFRSCIGRRVAESNIESFIRCLLQSFHIEWQGPPLKTSIGLLNVVHGPYNFVFKDL